MKGFISFQTGPEHPAIEDIERYSMGYLLHGQEALVEEHLLVCETCRTSVSEADQWTLLIKAALDSSEPHEPTSSKRNLIAETV